MRMALVSGVVGAADADAGPGAHFTTHGKLIPSYDEHTVRRRRRRQDFAQRCHGSKIDARDNCPHRGSCHVDESSSSGGRSCFKQSEMFSKTRYEKSSFIKILFDTIILVRADTIAPFQVSCRAGKSRTFLEVLIGVLSTHVHHRKASRLRKVLANGCGWTRMKSIRTATMQTVAA